MLRQWAEEMGSGVIEVLIVGGILAMGILLVIYGTIFKTRWGINSGVAKLPQSTRSNSRSLQFAAKRLVRFYLWPL
jgi:hypothetical protein